MNLTKKQESFVIEYLKDHNATQAAKRAGYSERRASEIGYQLLQKTTVSEAIYPFVVEDLDLEHELEQLEIDNSIKLRNIYKGLRVNVPKWDTGYFEGAILTINQGEVHLEVDDFYGEAYECVDYPDCYQGVHTFAIDDICELTILKK